LGVEAKMADHSGIQRSGGMGDAGRDQSVGVHDASAPHSLASEQTSIGEQILVYGVAPITPRDRLAMRANAPLEPKRPQRPADHGLFDTNARNQIEMF
jgi:hypothetical protein